MPKVCGPEDNDDPGIVNGFASVPHRQWTHVHVRNVAEAIVIAASEPESRLAAFNVGEEATPTMGERLAARPEKSSKPPELSPSDFEQPIVIDTSKIRREFGYEDIVDERAAIFESVSQADR